jgi:hypothetical protein
MSQFDCSYIDVTGLSLSTLPGPFLQNPPAHVDIFADVLLICLAQAFHEMVDLLHQGVVFGFRWQYAGSFEYLCRGVF